MLKPLRKLHVQDAKDAFRFKTNPLIVLNADSVPRYVNDPEEKRKILQTYSEENTYLFPRV